MALLYVEEFGWVREDFGGVLTPVFNAYQEKYGGCFDPLHLILTKKSTFLGKY